MKATSIRFEDDLHKKVKYICVEEEVSLNEYIMQLIKEDIVRREKGHKK